MSDVNSETNRAQPYPSEAMYTQMYSQIRDAPDKHCLRSPNDESVTPVLNRAQHSVKMWNAHRTCTELNAIINSSMCLFYVLSDTFQCLRNEKWDLATSAQEKVRWKRRSTTRMERIGGGQRNEVSLNAWKGIFATVSFFNVKWAINIRWPYRKWPRPLTGFHFSLNLLLIG